MTQGDAMREANVDLGKRPPLSANKTMGMGEILMVFASAFGVIWLVITLFEGNQIAYIGGIWAANLLMLAIIHAGLRMRGQSWKHFGLFMNGADWRSVARVAGQSVLVFVFAIFAFVAGAILMANLVGMPEPADMSQYDYLRGNLPMTMLALVSVYFVSSFAEEVIYRGFLITRLTELGSSGRTTRWLAVLVSSIVFGAVHSDWGLTGMVQASCMGLALGVSYYWVKRNLWVTILAHAYMDTILILQMYFGG